jgi:hypothetical protein
MARALIAHAEEVEGAADEPNDVVTEVAVLRV